MKRAHVVFESTEQKVFVFHRRQAELDLFADEQVLAVEDLAIDQLERAVPVRLRLFVGGGFRSQHRMYEKRPIDRGRENCHVTYVVGVMHDDAVGEDEVDQRGMVSRTPLLRRQLPYRLEAIAAN